MITTSPRYLPKVSIPAAPAASHGDGRLTVDLLMAACVNLVLDLRCSYVELINSHPVYLWAIPSTFTVVSYPVPGAATRCSLSPITRRFLAAALQQSFHESWHDMICTLYIVTSDLSIERSHGPRPFSFVLSQTTPHDTPQRPPARPPDQTCVYRCRQPRRCSTTVRSHPYTYGYFATPPPCVGNYVFLAGNSRAAGRKSASAPVAVSAELDADCLVPSDLQSKCHPRILEVSV